MGFAGLSLDARTHARWSREEREDNRKSQAATRRSTGGGGEDRTEHLSRTCKEHQGSIPTPRDSKEGLGRLAVSKQRNARLAAEERTAGEVGSVSVLSRA